LTTITVKTPKTRWDRRGCPTARGWSGEAAFSLVEALVAVLLTGVVFLTVQYAMSWCFNVAGAVQEEARAAQILQEKIDTIRLYHWERMTNDGFLPATFAVPFSPTGSPDTGLVFHGRMTLVDAPITQAYQTNLKLLTVEVSWISNDRTNQRSMTTFIAEHGMQTYITE
jgi:hypothetical protein